MADSVEYTQTEKASLLLLAMGQDKAASVLKNLGPKEVQTIGPTMASLTNISGESMDSVLEEFILTIKMQTGVGVDSDDYIRNMLTSALGEEKAGGLIDRILLGKNSKGIEQLKWMDARAVADLIRLEHPQIITIILSLLDADQSADILGLLPENMHSDLLMRIATLEGVQPAALKELDSIMEKQLTGSDNVQASELGDKIQEKMFVFADLIDVDDRGIQVILREVSTDQLLLALRGVEDGLKEKVFSNMSSRAAEMLRDDLEVAPPTKLSDVEQAQKDILTVARKLADSGEIMLGGGGGDELV
jgi:flagellar motor switch protein FliG